MIVDDAIEMARAVAEYLNGHGFAAVAVGSGAEAVERFRREQVDVVLTDLRMAGTDGLDVLDAIRAVDPAPPVVIMTAFGAVETAVEAIRRGAFHYVTKPFKLDVVRVLLERAIEQRSLQVENETLRRAVKQAEVTHTLVGRSAGMRKVLDLVTRVASTDTPVLILGETGTGKELVSRAIHEASPRARAPFVAVNCAALPDTLLESELFGHARGAFTGAAQPRRGLFVEADGGTLFLDEIGDMPLALQAKLLRALQSGEIRPVGGDSVRKVDVRVIAATHRDVPAWIREGKFREDLYYRLAVVPLRLPPLRERIDDLPLLIERFVADAHRKFANAQLTGFEPEAMRLLIAHRWPGNVRELENLVQRLVVTSPERDATAEAVREVLTETHPAADATTSGETVFRELVPLAAIEQRYIEHVLEQVGGNKTRAAEILGIDPSTLYRRLARPPG
jgi:two-component system response regulator HydG